LAGDGRRRMSLTDDDKRAEIEAKRGTLEHEQYAAELDVATAEAAGVEALVEEPTARLGRVNAQLAVLDEKEAELS